MKTKIEDDFIYPVDIGTWQSYQPYSNEEQIAFQKEHLIETPLYTELGSVKFIYTKYIAELNKYLLNLVNEIKIEDTTTIIEDEVYYTTKIEGATTTRTRTSEIHNGKHIKDDNESEIMVKNAFDAVKILNVCGNKVNEEILLKVWNTLVKDCCHNESVRGDKYRIGKIYAGDFEGANFENIPEMMNKWLSFYNHPMYNSMPFIKAILLHYTFETIHPFPDGNGRLGRMLMSNYLIKQGIDSAKAVSFSMQIDKTRVLYDGAFISSENKMNDCTPFINYMLDTFINSYQTALDIMKEKEVNVNPGNR